MPFTTPSPQTLTLRLKHHKTTILLHVDPLTDIKSLKEELLRALQETTPSKVLNGHRLPTSASDLILGKPRDANDSSRGWVRVKEGDGDVVKALGVREGAVLVFKWGDADEGAGAAASRATGREKKKFIDEALGDEDLADVDLEMDDDEEEEVEEEWDVVIPSYEDVWGMEASMSQGQEDEDGVDGVEEEPVTPKR